MSSSLIFFIKYESSLKEEEVNDQKPYLIFKQDAFILNYINSLNLLLQSGIVLSDEFNLLKLEELLLYLLKLYPEKLRSLLIVAKDNEDMQLRKAVESHIGHSITVEDLAFLCYAITVYLLLKESLEVSMLLLPKNGFYNVKCSLLLIY
ncbi:hypothetical protein [Pedobacter sp. NJ-S-72]